MEDMEDEIYFRRSAENLKIMFGFVLVRGENFL
jgi:hypothetical protein